MKFDNNNDRIAKLEVRQIQGTCPFLENQDDFKGNDGINLSLASNSVLRGY